MGRIGNRKPVLKSTPIKALQPRTTEVNADDQENPFLNQSRAISKPPTPLSTSLKSKINAPSCAEVLKAALQEQIKKFTAIRPILPSPPTTAAVENGGGQLSSATSATLQVYMDAIRKAKQQNTTIPAPILPNPIVPDQPRTGNKILLQKIQHPRIAPNNQGGGGDRQLQLPQTDIARKNNTSPDLVLRQFSARVMAKVEEKGITTYNEVADELLSEMQLEEGFDHKNVRRRVYDALNVLMAIDIIQKDKKEIRWLGLPSENNRELEALKKVSTEQRQRIDEKQKRLKDLVGRYVAFRNLIYQNSLDKQQSPLSELVAAASAEPRGPGTSTPNPFMQRDSAVAATNISNQSNDKLDLPFVLVSAPADCQVHLEMLDDRTEFAFTFDMPYQITEDVDILRVLGFDSAPSQLLSWWLPEELIPYAKQSENVK